MPCKVIKPEDSDQTVDAESVTVFLAGSIDNGAATLWAKEVEASCHDLDITFFNPRRENWNSALVQRASEPMFKQQVTWELDRIAIRTPSGGCDIPFFYFEAGSISPITLQELGFVFGSRSAFNAYGARTVMPIVVCPIKYWRRGNVEIMCARHGVPVYSELSPGIEALRFAISNLHKRGN